MITASAPARATLALACLAAPWFIPPALPPTPALVPWLIALVCIAILLILAGVGANHDASTTAEFVAWSWLIAAIGSSLIGLCQYVGVAEHIPLVSASEGNVAYANLRQRNQFASLCVIGMAALLYLSHKWRAKRPLPRGLVYLAAIVIALGNALSSSRTGALTFALLLGISWRWGYWRTKPQRQVLGTMTIVYLVMQLLLPIVAGDAADNEGAFLRLTGPATACSGRWSLWRDMVYLIAERPWTGWGWGELGYAHFITLFPHERHCEMLDNAHNLGLHLAVELGLPVALSLCGVTLWWVCRAQPWREGQPDRQMVWTVLSVLFVHSMLEYPLWYAPFMMALLSCGAVLSRILVTSRMDRTHHEYSYWKIGSGLLLVAACTYGAWDYFRVQQIYLPPAQRAPAYRGSTLAKIQDSWLFHRQVQFAEFSITPLSTESAARLFTMGQELLHYSPEPRVVEKLVEAATMSGHLDAAKYYLKRYKAAYPNDYARWALRHDSMRRLPSPTSLAVDRSQSKG